MPDDPAQREAALALEADITELQTHWIALEGVTQAQALLTRAERVGWPGATADIEVFLARQLIDGGRTDEAAPLLERAAQHAAAARDDDLRVVAWTELAFLLGVMQTRIPEALRLASLLAAHPLASQPRVHALVALMYFNTARLAGRVDEAGQLLRLENQDRSKWDHGLIARGLYRNSWSSISKVLRR